MSSKAPKFKSIKYTGMKTNRKLFNVELSHTRPTPHYKPRFYTNKNLFFVRNMKKYNSNKNKKKLKLNFMKNQRNLLARREFRKKHGLFITHHNKPTNTTLVKKEGQSPKPTIKFKKRLKIKFSVTKENQQTEIINENIINEQNIQNNTNLIISQFTKITQIQNNNNNPNNNFTLSEDNNFLSLSNNNTTMKPNLKNSKYAQGRWHLSEHKKFLEAIIKYGNDWKEVEKYIGTRTSSQARSHAQKFFIKLKQEQMNSKISSTIDYSNATIKNFHDTLQNMDDDKREKIIKELENVVFDSQVGNKKRRRNKSKGGGCFSESCTDYGVISGTDFLEDDSFLVDDDNNKNNKGNRSKRKMSVDSLGEKEDKRKFLEEIENSKNAMFTDEEYEKSFHKVFSDKEGNNPQPESRKQSIEDDFMFNINI